MRAQRKANKVEWKEKSAMDQRADSQSPGDRLAAEEGDGCHFPNIMKEAGEKARQLWAERPSAVYTFSNVYFSQMKC